ncbi:MAG: hypothetical protein EA351_10175 [Gemmatimonadales bacterium]|nr:MAG: hypothetical protein EA351_10175 [Gemmatimonadales bacterium]
MIAVWGWALLLAQGGLAAPDPGAASALVAGPVAHPAHLPADSAQLLGDARTAQARFERLRIRNAPYTWGWSQGECTERVGRLCLQLSGTGREPDPWATGRQVEPEGETVIEARAELLEELERVAREIPGDPWVVGQWVRYLGEAGDWKDALEAARGCRSTRPGWCDSLEALAAHGLGEMDEAERLHRRAIEQMDPEEREARLDPEWLVDVETWRALRDLDGAERDALVERIWRRANPWFSTPVNELWVEHLSRHTRAEIREGTRTPYGFNWGRDLAQILVRFGEESGFERIRETSLQLGPPPVIGRGQVGARFLLPSARALLDQEAPEPSDFSTEGLVARSLHRAGVTHRIRDLEAQVARFQRGDSLLVAAAWRYPPPPEGHEYWEGVAADTLPPPRPRLPESALLLQPWDPPLGWNGEHERMRELVRGSRPVAGGEGEAGGYALSLGSPGTKLLSIEVREPERARGWRYRDRVVPVSHRAAESSESSESLESSGSSETSGAPGQLSVSDLLLLEIRPDAEIVGRDEPPSDGVITDSDGTIESVVPRAAPSLRLAPAPVELAWEVYGLGEPVEYLTVLLEVGSSERGVFRRLGEALRIVGARTPTRIRWEERVEVGEAPGSPLFRRLGVDLSDLSSGVHELRLEVSLANGERAEATLRIEIDPSSD